MLGGGGALGAFEAGLYEAFDEAGLVPDRLAGTSIGAVNGALIAGNAPERRVERLRQFWQLVAQPGAGNGPWSGDARRVAKALAALRARLAGRPGLYAPVLPRLFLETPRWGSPSLYDTSPALATLRRLVDFERIAAGEPRIAVNLTDLTTGEPVVVDNATTRVRPEHLLASIGLLPEFPPIEIEGRWFCDGGFSANLPVQAVLDPPPEEDLLCVAVDLLGEPGPPVFSIDGMLERSNDLLFANQTRAALVTLEARYSGRAEGSSIVLLVVACDGRGERIAQKIWDYGEDSIAERWRAGREAATALLGQIGEIETPAPGRLEVRRMVVRGAAPG